MTREQFLAALYTDAQLCERFIAEPRATALAAGLPEDDARALAAMDMEALRLAARSFEKKRAHAHSPLLPARGEKVPRSGG